jgi:3-methyl-2-oxobutanoate hydroxymethyltransferase
MINHVLKRSLAAQILQTPTSTTSPLTSALRAGTRSATVLQNVYPTTIRHSSHSPIGAATARKKITLQTLQTLYARNEPITMITAHDFPSAHVAEHAGMEMILVGDSLAMVALGLDDTSSVLLEEMILHCRSVSRGAASPFIVGDLPMGSYEVSPEQALQSAIRMVKEGHVHAVKLEGGVEMAPQIRKIVTAGIPVLAHIGLTPQKQNSLGGFRVQGKSVAGAVKLLEDAKAVQEAGAFGVVVEAVPEKVATAVTRHLRIPTIGIGAGNGCSGQVLVQVDMAGYFPPGRKIPKFVKKFGDLWGEASRALETYKQEVKDRSYPAPEHTYPMPKEELAEFERLVEAGEKDAR